MILRYLTPSQRDVGHLMVYLAESIHEDIPAEELYPITKHIIDQFVGEHVTEDKMVIFTF